MYKRVEYRHVSAWMATYWRDWGFGVGLRFERLLPYIFTLYLGPVRLELSYESDDDLPF